MHFCFKNSDLSESVTATINYYRCAFQYPEVYARIADKKVLAPVLSIFGTDDKFLSIEAARGTRRYVENLTEDYVDGVGHWVQMEDPKRVNKSMEDFLLFHGPKASSNPVVKSTKEQKSEEKPIKNGGSKKVEDTLVKTGNLKI